MDIHNVASKGVANAGLTTGIIGTSLGALNAMGGAGGLLGGLFGGGCNGGWNNAWNMAGCSENMLVNRYELGQAQEIESLKSQIALRDANTFTDSKMLEMYKYIDGKLETVNGTLATQAVYNATQTATINCMQGQIAQLFGLTKLVVPNTSVCPGWGNVTITPSTTTTGA